MKKIRQAVEPVVDRGTKNAASAGVFLKEVMTQGSGSVEAIFRRSTRDLSGVFRRKIGMGYCNCDELRDVTVMSPPSEAGSPGIPSRRFTKTEP